jgi:hypothetical protein
VFYTFTGLPRKEGISHIFGTKSEKNAKTLDFIEKKLDKLRKL